MKRSDWPQEVPRKPWTPPDLRRGRFAKLDERKPPSWRSKRPGMSPSHLINIRSLPCSVCEGREGIEAHHLKSAAAAKERGVFMRATDRWSTPLCREHHNSVERIGSRRERDWFSSFGIDCHALAQGLWNAKADAVQMDFVLRAHKQQAIRTLSAQRQLVVDLRSGEWRCEP